MKKKRESELRRDEQQNEKETKLERQGSVPVNGRKDSLLTSNSVSSGSRGFTNGLPANGRVNGIGNRGRGFSNGLMNGLNSRRRGLTNGLVNGLTNGRNGFSNGLINGLGNGKKGFYNGLVNGLERKNGWVNGNGFINGFRMTNVRRGIPLQKKSFSLRIALILVLTILIILGPFYVISMMPSSAIKIDGYFFDWDRAGYFEEVNPSAPFEIDIREYSMVVWRGTIYCYISTTAPMFSDPGGNATSFYSLFDMDNDGETGYIVDDIGADMMVEIIGWNDSVKASRVSNFALGANRSDFNGFIGNFSALAKASENQLEFSFSGANIDNPTVRFMAKNWDGREDVSMFAIRFNEPAVRASLDYILPGIITPETRVAALALELTGQKGDIEISELNFTKLGNSSDFELFLYEDSVLRGHSTNGEFIFDEPILVQEGYKRSLMLFVEADAKEMTCTFGLTLDADGVVTDDGPAVVYEVQTLEKVAYIGEIPGEVVIDGAFGDWSNGFIMLDGDNDVEFENGTTGIDESIDIMEYGMFVGEKDLAMYLSVDDIICNGTLVPKDLHLPVDTQGLPSFESPELLGADVAGAVIDTDLNSSTGSTQEDIKGGDYLVLIAGKKGKILLSELYEWDPDAGENSTGEWRFLDNVKSAIDSRRMEFAFLMDHIALDNNSVAAVGFFMTDWKEGTDYSDSLLPLARLNGNWYNKAFGGIIINEVYHVKDSLDWVEFYNTGTQPISLDGWILYDGRTILYTFGTVTLNSGDFLVVQDLVLGKKANIMLVDDQGVVIDSKMTLENKKDDRSVSRWGDPPYKNWKKLLPSPGGLNPGQTAIPEFSSVITPILGMLVIILVFRIKKRRKLNGA